MTSGQKIAFSLLAALCIFAGLILSLNSRLFKELETRFYTQAKIEENTGQLDKISESCDSYISEILSLVEKGENAWVKNASVRSYYVQNPSESDINTRRRLTEELFAQIPALNGIRIVDKNGRNVHYSSFDDTDVLKQNGISKIYKNYNDISKDAGEIPFETLAKLTDETKSVLLCDQEHGRFILTVPFCWVDGIYSGTSLFYLNVHEVEKALVARDVISFNQGMTLFSDENMNGGVILNIPYGSRADFKLPILKYWKSTSSQPEKLLELPDGRFYVALSSHKAGRIKVSAVYTSDVFEISKEIRILIYICIFISILLIVFLIFSFIRDPVVTLQKRIKKIQLGIINNYLDGKEKKEWSEIGKQLRLRRKDLSEEIIRSLHVHSKKRRAELAEYLDKNWEDIFAIFETKTGDNSAATASSAGAEISGASIAEIRRMLEEVLQNRSVAAPVVAAATAATVAAVKKQKPVKVEEPEEIEEIEEAEELDEVEELAEDAEELDEVEELAEEVDDAEEVEELTEDAEELDEAEELAEDAEELDEVEELAEEVDDAEEVEELTEEVDDAEEVEELTEDVDELEDAEEVEELEDAGEELEVLDEYVDHVQADRDFLAALAPPPKEFVPSNETYFVSEKFAHVENLYAEKLCLGDEHPVYKVSPVPVDVFPMPQYEDLREQKAETSEDKEDKIEDNVKEPEEEFIDEPVEELYEDVQSLLKEPEFTMTRFADNLDSEVPELEGAADSSSAPENTIIEKDGVYSIAENLEFTNIVQDPEFKELVDSIL